MNLEKSPKKELSVEKKDKKKREDEIERTVKEMGILD